MESELTPLTQFKITSSSCITSIYKLLYILDMIFNKNGVEYWIDGGTLIGALRHNGIIPWDDDGDVQIWNRDKNKLESLRGEFEKYGIILIHTYFGYKIFFKNGKKIDRFKWLYPFIDIFLMKKYNDKVVFSYPRAQKIFSHYYFETDKMYPLQRYSFGSFHLTGISKDYAEEYLNRSYGNDWKDYAYQMYDHENEKSIKNDKLKLTSSDKLPAYPIDFNKDDLIIKQTNQSVFYKFFNH